MHNYLSPWSRLYLFTLQDCICWLLCYLITCATLLSRLPITFVILLLLLPHYSVTHWYYVCSAPLLPLLPSYLCNFDCPITLLLLSFSYLKHSVTSLLWHFCQFCYFATSVTLLLLLPCYFVTLDSLFALMSCYLCHLVTSVTWLP